MSVPPMQPAERIGAPASAAGIVGIVGSVGMAGAPLAAAMPLPAAAIGGGPPLPDDPALGEGGVIVPAEPLALLPAVAVGEAEAGAPAVAVPVVPPEVVGGVVPVGVVASGDVVAGFGFAASLLHAVHASASPRSAVTSAVCDHHFCKNLSGIRQQWSARKLLPPRVLLPRRRQGEAALDVESGSLVRARRRRAGRGLSVGMVLAC
ncbi:MAG TPA: hypothetical protein VFG30_10055 [Polyangiales bacterium]|nr:hypothetical protein [Polyangiales bacterium]